MIHNISMINSCNQLFFTDILLFTQLLFLYKDILNNAYLKSICT